jgi:hypothetical protein
LRENLHDAAAHGAAADDGCDEVVAMDIEHGDDSTMAGL